MTDISSQENGKILDYPESRKPSQITKSPADQTSQILVLLSVWKDILNARLLAVIALIGALAIFGFTIYDPNSLRLMGCAGYSIGILWPIVWLYVKRGE